MAKRVYDGTELDDLLSGSKTADAITGFGGDDVLVGQSGNDDIDGGLGRDIVDGGAGSDLLLGGADNDVLIAMSGNDSLDGGIGNDRFLVNGRANDTVYIIDPEGKDTLNVSGADTSARIDLRPGNVSRVDGRKIIIAGGDRDVDVPLDLVLTQDLSGSFGDDVFTVRSLSANLVNAVGRIASDVRFGVTSFVDKPISPFGVVGDHEYQTELGLTRNATAFTNAINGLVVQNGFDEPESQLTALLQNAVRTGEIGWNAGALKIVVLTTDAPFHEAGDYGTVKSNEGDAILDGPGRDGTGEDYPSVMQTATALKAAGIIPIFAVTSNTKATYDQLVDDLGFGIVVNLSSDSSDIIAAVRKGIKKIAETVIENAVGGRLDDDIVGNKADNMIKGRAGDDELRGLDGRDDLRGGKGRDTIKGGDGADDLEGGSGADVMTGGNNLDTFVFGKKHGKDTITDFNPTREVLDMTETGLSYGDITRTRVGNDTEITSSQGTILLEDVLPRDIDASDFLFNMPT